MQTNSSSDAKQVELCAVNKRFGSTVAVSDINLNVHAGEFLTLLGPSGCGKTTLLRMISGLEPVSSGHILLGGEDVTTVPPNKRDISMMFQDYALFPHKTVVDNISYGLKMARMPEAEQQKLVDYWLQRTELSEQCARLPRELSGGQRQRVALARALVVEPGVLLLDEPLAALDAGLRRQLQQELKKIHQGTGVTFIAVTHDQEEAITMSDRIAIMRAGKIEQLGAPEDIYQHPRTAFVARFIGRCNIVAGTLSGDRNDRYINTEVLGRLSPYFDPNELNKLSTGDLIEVAIRPESIELAETGMPAIVDDVQFCGSTYRLAVVVNHTHSLEIISSANRQPPVPGDTVKISARPGAATVLSA